MKQIDAELYAKVMSLPLGIRLDLLEFFGAQPVIMEPQDRILEDFFAPVEQDKKRTLH